MTAAAPAVETRRDPSGVIVVRAASAGRARRCIERR